RNHPVDHIAFAGPFFDHVHGIAVDGGILAEPCVVDQIGTVDDHGVAFPVTNGVSVEGRIERLVMSTSVGGDDTKGVLLGRVYRIEVGYGVFGNLPDLSGRTFSRKTLWRALERGVLVTLMLAE